jgi:hypothetical protein
MIRAQAFEETAPTIFFSDVPPDVVQDVQVAQAQAFGAGPEPAPGGEIFFSDVPPDVIQEVQVAAMSSRARPAMRAPTPAPMRAFALDAGASTLADTVAQLRASGVADTEIRDFLEQIGTSYTFAMGAEGVTVILPGGRLLSPVQGELLLAAIATQIGVVAPAVGPLLLPLLRLLPEVANRFGVTIGIGPAITAGMVAGATFGGGVMFAPNKRVGVYGAIGGVLGAIVSISATMQVTIVHGGPELFGGTAVAVSIGAGEGVVGGASALLVDGRFIGVTFALGIGAGLSPIEAYAQYQYTATSMGLRYRYA